MRKDFLDFPVEQPVVALIGPTAIGKTDLSLQIAERFSCEIVSLDSMQVYRYMNIGTAKASPRELALIPHHLIDIVDPDQPYDANDYVSDALEAIVAIHGRGKIPLLVGGTGLYLRALLEGLFACESAFPSLRQELQRRLEDEGASKLHEELSLYDQNSASRIHKNDTHRLLRALEIYHGTGRTWSEHLEAQKGQDREGRFSRTLLLGLTCERDALYRRINARTAHMLEQGLEREVRGLLDRGYDRSLKAMQSIGYRHMTEHILDGVPMEKTLELIARDTRRYAKRQYTWFRKMDIEWHFQPCEDAILKRIERYLHDKEQMNEREGL